MTAEHVINEHDSTFGTTSDAILALLAAQPTPLDLSGEAIIAARAVIDESLGVHAHWDTRNPIDARAIVKGYMRRRHSDLSEAALDALAVHCTRDFRH